MSLSCHLVGISSRCGKSARIARRKLRDAGHLGRDPPEALGVAWDDRVRVDAAEPAHLVLRVGRLSDVAVLAVDAAHAFELRGAGGPGRRRGTLLRRLEAL